MTRRERVSKTLGESNNHPNTNRRRIHLLDHGAYLSLNHEPRPLQKAAFSPCSSFTAVSTYSKQQTIVCETSYLLKLEIILYKLAVNKRNYVMKITCQWENNEQLHEALSPTSGAVESPNNPQEL